MARDRITYDDFKKLTSKNRFELKPDEVEVHPKKKPRSDRFILRPEDVVIHPRRRRGKKLHEMTYGDVSEVWFPNSTEHNPSGVPDHGHYDNPRKEPKVAKNPHGFGYSDSAKHVGHSAHNPNIDHDKSQFVGHARRIDQHHPKVTSSIQHYKEMGYESINKALRGGHHVNNTLHHHIKNLDKATSFRTKHDMHVYRGVAHHAMEFHKMEPGTEFTDHGYGSHSHRHATASAFAGFGKKHIFKVHVPKGTHAHHFDHHQVDNDHENETVLARGTRYRVTHHSHDGDHHYIHATVVGQHGRKVHHDPSLGWREHSGQEHHVSADMDESYEEFLFEEVEKHPHSKMRDYSKKELDWEYHTEYEKYSKPYFPHAFKSREHFQKKYDKAPTRHLTDHEHEHLGNYGGDHKDMKSVERAMSHRRDVHQVAHDLNHGHTAPPIVLKHKHGLHLMAGNTRLSVASAHKKRIPVKVIDVDHDD